MLYLSVSRAYHLNRKFGITEDDYNDLLRKQMGCCAVCKRPANVFKKRLAVDHDHHTGHVRGILCLHCNRYVVGRHRKEAGADLLLNAYKYLMSDYPGWVVPKRKKKRCKKRRKKLRSGT